MSDWVFERTPEHLASWADFLNQRPPRVRAVAERLPPWNLYRMKSTGHRVTVFSFDQPEVGGEVTLTVIVLKRWNPSIKVERRVFGIKPDDLEICAPPETQ